MSKKIFLILLLGVIIGIYLKCEDTYIIPSSAIRLRVIPNSNNPQDIYIKEKVKHYLENNVYSLTKNITTKKEAADVITSNLPKIDKNINDIFIDNNYNIPYTVNYGNNYFPKKMYKGITYKEGYYESLVISIGDAKGDNFWCVLFPNLCLVHREDEHTYKSYIKELLNKIF